MTKAQESSKLLNTEEAARFLRVSEASIRRWSDAGLLPARRIGGRRERRFREPDLIAFLGAAPASTGHPAGAQTEVNVGGVQLQLHTHLATFYDSDSGRLRLAVPFLADGIRAGQPCFLAAADDVVAAYTQALRCEEVDVDSAVKEGRFVPIAGGPGATVQGALDFWEQQFWPSRAAGQTVIRVVGEMSSERKLFASDAEMMSYEAAFSTLSNRFPIVTLCQYDVREFDGETIFQAIKVHPDLFGLHLGSFLN
jgi:transcriptional repressor of dcmA and dcmR